MGDGRPLEITFPTKGVQATGPRQQQPDGTVAPEAMLNMLPFDRTGRARGAQRHGLSKVTASALIPNAAVQQMTQATLVLDPTTVVATNQVFNETFTGYANGTTLDNAISAGQTSAYWKTWSDFDNTTEVGRSITELSTSSAKVGPTLSQTGINILQPPLNVGQNYIVKMTFKAADPLTGNCFYNIFARVGATTRTSIRCAITCSGATGQQMVIDSPDATSGATAALTNGTIVTGGTYILEMRVSGNSISGWLNGTQIIAPFTMAHSNGLSGFAWFMGVPLGSGDFSAARASNFTVLSGVAANYRKNYLVAVCGGNVYQGDLTGVSVVTSGTGVVAGGVKPSMTFSQGNVYIVDGVSILKLSLSNVAMQAYAATAGVAPTLCTIATMYRDRLVLAGQTTSPQNMFFSRVGTHTDWDYSQTDPAAAFAGNASTSGRIGEPITALIPLSDDLMLIGGDHNLWMMRGDPAADGSIDLISDDVGILGMDAWCKSPDGTVYFCGSGGLYRMTGETQPTEIASGKYAEFFRAINRVTNFVTMEWDRDRHGCLICVTPVDVTVQPTCLWYDQREDGFFPMQFPSIMGPQSVYAFDGDAQGERVCLMGGRDGFIRQHVQSATSDDGTAINAFVVIGPFKPGAEIGYGGQAMPGSDLTEGALDSIDIILGEVPSGFTAGANWSCTLSILSGHDANVALNSPVYTRSKTLTKAGRQTRWLMRQRGVSMFFKLANATLDKFFSFERATAVVRPCGTERR